jgi:hypothetical protein
MYVAILRVKANKLFNKKLYPWPKYAIFVYKNILSSIMKNRLFTLVPLRNRHFPKWKQFLKMEMDWIVKLVFIGEKANVHVLLTCGCQSLWIIDHFGGMLSEPYYWGECKSAGSLDPQGPWKVMEDKKNVQWDWLSYLAEDKLYQHAGGQQCKSN